MISIIMPFFNNQKSLHSAIESVLSQTFQDFELIAVDDGSTDNGDTEVLAFKDPKIRLLKKQNGGVSSARNEGILHARGEFITFLDADDSYMKEYLTILNQSKAYDLVSCGIEYSDGNIIESLDCSMELMADDFPRNMDSLLEKGILNSPVTKLYHTDIIKKNKINFPEDMQKGEDLFFNFQYLKHCESLKVIPDPLYRYNQTDKGLHRTYNPDVLEQRKKNIDMLDDYYLSNGLERTIIYEMKLKLIYIYCMQEIERNTAVQKIADSIFIPYFDNIRKVRGFSYAIMKMTYQTHQIRLILMLSKQMLKMRNNGKRIKGASV